MQDSDAEKERFYRDGFIVIPGAVPQQLARSISVLLFVGGQN